MGRIAVTHLGLAAFIKMSDVDLVEVVAETFIFDSDLSANEWRVKYNNSCCMKYDTMVCELRHYLKAP